MYFIHFGKYSKTFFFFNILLHHLDRTGLRSDILSWQYLRFYIKNLSDKCRFRRCLEEMLRSENRDSTFPRGIHGWNPWDGVCVRDSQVLICSTVAPAQHLRVAALYHHALGGSLSVPTSLKSRTNDSEVHVSRKMRVNPFLCTSNKVLKYLTCNQIMFG